MWKSDRTANRQNVAANLLLLYDDKGKAIISRLKKATHIEILIMLKCASRWVVEFPRGTFCHVSRGN